MTILIVDDEALLRDKIRSVLENAHLPVREYYLAANAIDAMKIVDEKEPDIVLSDIRMPTKTGLELAAYINEAHPQYAGDSDHLLFRFRIRPGSHQKPGVRLYSQACGG